ncbi:MAG: hypothetical protein NTZ72_01840 [Afipia sp.]|nr:hypothetical protein [Afipia sp.]
MIFSSELKRRWLSPLVVGILISPLAAQNAALDKPFLDANDFYLRSAGFRVKLANDPVSQKALRALPPNKMVAQKTAAGIWYVFADPKICVCIFAGTKDNLDSRPSHAGELSAEQHVGHRVGFAGGFFERLFLTGMRQQLSFFFLVTHLQSD